LCSPVRVRDAFFADDENRRIIDICALHKAYGLLVQRDLFSSDQASWRKNSPRLARALGSWLHGVRCTSKSRREKNRELSLKNPRKAGADSTRQNTKLY